MRTSLSFHIARDMHLCACVRVRVCVCERACLRALSVRVCVRACAIVHRGLKGIPSTCVSCFSRCTHSSPKGPVLTRALPPSLPVRPPAAFVRCTGKAMPRVGRDWAAWADICLRLRGHRPASAAKRMGAGWLRRGLPRCFAVCWFVAVAVVYRFGVLLGVVA